MTRPSYRRTKFAQSIEHKDMALISNSVKLRPADANRKIAGKSRVRLPMLANIEAAGNPLSGFFKISTIYFIGPL